MAATQPLMNTYARQPVAFSHGDGPWLYDSDGRRYLDCLAGIAVNTLGHNHPKLVAALREQVARMIHSSNLFEVPLQTQLGAKLVELSGMTNVFFCNSGLEANEAALKIARKYGHERGIDRPEVVVYERAFHGRSIATLSATGNDKVQKGFEPLVEGFVRVPLNDLAALERVAAERPNVVAVFLEAIQGEGGIQPARVDYLQSVRRLCDRLGWLLMIDEVQCGTGRTGKWFAHQWAGIRPGRDATGQGPGARGCRSARWWRTAPPPRCSSPATTAPRSAAIRWRCAPAWSRSPPWKRKACWRTPRTIGQTIMSGIERGLAGTPGFVEVRGQGLMIGIELDRPCGALVARALEAGLVLNVTADRVVRLLPPLIFRAEHAGQLVDTLVPMIRRFLEESGAKAA